jgi:hypothetical protein
MQHFWGPYNIHPLWPAPSPGMTPYDCYLCGSLKDRVYQNNPHTEDEIIGNITCIVSSVYRQELQKVVCNKSTPCVKHA